jgi:hypothetical protein
MGILRFRYVALASSLLLAELGGACSSEVAAVSGSCTVDPSPELACGRASDGTLDETLGLIGYSCTGSARPDEQATYVEGVPSGLVCADRGPVGPEGKQGYCCTTAATACAYNPVAICDPPNYGYQCRGANRPESLNPAILCGQGVRQDDLINYCCSGSPQPDGCLQSDSVRCSPRLSGWTCLGGNLPKGEELGANKSRADSYYLLCPVPTPAPNPAYNNYCCYPPALVPIGGSCVAHTSVPGCPPGKFGFACYGPDRPEDDYLPMRCPEPGFPGTSAQGYPATLYCCDFQ